MPTRQRRSSPMAVSLHSLRRSAAVVIALAGLLLVTCEARAGWTIYMSAAGDRVDQVTPPGPRSQFAQLPFGTNPEGVAFDGLGNLFVAGGGDVSKITPGGVVSHVADLPVGAGGYGLAIDGAGNLYVADVSLNEISKVTQAGVVTTYASIPANPTDLTFDALGNLYVVSAADPTIRKIAPGGTVSTYATLPSNSVNNYGLAFDASGNLFVSVATNLTLFEVAPGGGSVTTFGTLTGSGAKGLAFDASGNLYVSEYASNQIEMIKPNGDTSVFASVLDNPRYIALRPAAVPEPLSWTLLAAGLAVIFLHRRLHTGARRVDGNGVAREGRQSMYVSVRRWPILTSM